MGTGHRRWLFADQLGDHFLDDDDQPVLLVEARSVLERRRFHRQKAHLVLSALRHRAAELGDRVIFARTRTYGEALDAAGEPLTVCHPTSHAAAAFVSGRARVTVLPARGFTTTREDFAAWAEGRGDRRLLMEDFYRDARRRLGVLMDGDEPAGGRWNFDADNREPPPRGGFGVPGPWRPDEDEIDEEVRRDLDRWERDGVVAFVGRDGPRSFPATRAEAAEALARFVAHRLPCFGPYQDAMSSDDPVMAHSLLSPALNLGLLDPMDCVREAERAYQEGRVPLRSAEGYIRQLIGWRDYIWHLYWHLGPGYRRENRLSAHTALPEWFAELDADAVEARCLSWALGQVRDHGFAHHIVRLMVLGNYAIQRAFEPGLLTDWFHRCFVDGYDWVMTPNVVGMSQHADGGVLATKPYTSAGAYINRMSDFCHACRYRPDRRTGADACPFTTGYWSFVARNEELLAANPRTARSVYGMRRLADIDEVRAIEADRGDTPP
ncbi:cryptochrome/photolyase family protein [Planotetraspora kaengkrachanensis]|uniref:Deoxyribodipyrimidine photo-lyase n=1 Tax=Planotetraspora kaengkrachanensis TaxID=575193 RepID=A0A8J3LU93_9ACTN|nr:cryptochrome/photolyase family protein [Planotetraspora kaengkrachanensis]GIG79253.1 deoxyribodipyrimidine photo-lyase [Planotetraspora kaengkrachanensis]